MIRASWTRTIIVSVLALIVLAAIAHLFWPHPVPVDLAPVARGGLRVTVNDEGRTRVRDVYVVSSPLPGRVRRIDVEVGDPVTAAETLLASINPTKPGFLDVRSHAQAEAVVKAAEAAAALARAEAKREQAELVFARSDLERARTLVAKNTISQRALERAELDVKIREAALASATAALDVRQFELEQARAALIMPMDVPGPDSHLQCCVEIRAPVTGAVLRLLHESEGVVVAGTPLLEIGDPRDLEIIADLLSTDAVKISADADVTIERWGGEGLLRGRVKRVEPYGFTKVSALGIEEQRVNVIIDLTDPPERWRALGHGYRVDVAITLWQDDDILKLPLGALFRDGEAWAVFLATDGRAAVRHVEIGHRNEHFAELTTGLDAGDLVVLHPSDRLSDGISITPRKDGD